MCVLDLELNSFELRQVFLLVLVSLKKSQLFADIAICCFNNISNTDVRADECLGFCHPSALFFFWS